jgi:hypothetical protein
MRRRPLSLDLSLLVSIAVAAFFAARAEPLASGQSAQTADGISFTAPTGWSEANASPGVVEALHMRGAVAYAPAEASAGMAIVGHTSEPVPTPATRAAAAGGQVLLTVFDKGYIGVQRVSTIAGAPGPSRVTVYSALMERAAVVLACVHGVGAGAAAALGQCARIATTLRIPAQYGTPIEPAELRRIGARVQLILASFEGQRRQALLALLRAGSPSGQARAAVALSRLSYASARDLRNLPYDPFEQLAEVPLARLLQGAAVDYGLLAVAVSKSDRSAYALAAARVERAERSLCGTLSSLAARA